MVYAKIDGVPFPRWLRMAQAADLVVVPDNVIMVETTEFRPKSVADDRYDAAGLEGFIKIQNTFSDALNYLIKKNLVKRVVVHKHRFEGIEKSVQELLTML